MKTSFSLKCGLHILVEKVLEGHNITVTRTHFHNPLGDVDMEEFITKFKQQIK